MIVHALFIEDLEHVTVFLGLMEVEDRIAHHLHERASFLLAKMQLDCGKMICIGTYGASNMIGCLNGVTTCFK